MDDTMLPWDMSSQTEASNQCIRMVLNPEGIRQGWQVERMPHPRVMPDMLMLPDGKILIVNGAHTGLAGYGNVSGFLSLYFG